MSRSLIVVVFSSILLAVGGAACSSGTTPQDLVPPPHGPPLATGEVCVDATPATAIVTVDGAVMTERCQSYTTSYTSSVEVVISAPGFVSQTHSVSLMGGSLINGTQPLTVDLVAVAAE